MPSLGKIVALTLCIVTLPQIGAAAEKIHVFVSIAPQRYFIQQIGKERVTVQVMIPPGANPVTYEPKPAQMTALADTQIYFAIGVPFEKAWLPRIETANPRIKIVHTDAGIEKIAMSSHHDVEVPSPHHMQQERSASDGQDPHVWLSPPLVKIQARDILMALKTADPAHSAVYEENCRRFEHQIDQLDADLKKIFAGNRHLRFMVFHPSWGYFARAYGLQQIPIEMEGKTPKPAQLKALIQQAREADVKVIFVQPQFSTKSAELIAREIGGQVTFADPLAADWMDNLKRVAGKFEAALK